MTRQVLQTPLKWGLELIRTFANLVLIRLWCVGTCKIFVASICVRACISFIFWWGSLLSWVVPGATATIASGPTMKSRCLSITIRHIIKRSMMVKWWLNDWMILKGLAWHIFVIFVCYIKLLYINPQWTFGTLGSTVTVVGLLRHGIASGDIPVMLVDRRSPNDMLWILHVCMHGRLKNKTSQLIFVMMVYLRTCLFLRLWINYCKKVNLISQLNHQYVLINL